MLAGNDAVTDLSVHRANALPGLGANSVAMTPVEIARVQTARSGQAPATATAPGSRTSAPRSDRRSSVRAREAGRWSSRRTYPWVTSLGRAWLTSRRTRGKGSHGTLYCGDRHTVVKDRRKPLKTGTLRAMCKQLGIEPNDL